MLKDRSNTFAGGLVYGNAIRVMETDGTLKLHSEAYVDFYRSTSDLRSSLEIEPVVSN